MFQQEMIPRHGGQRRCFARQYGFRIDEIFDFSVNVFPYPLPEPLHKEIYLDEQEVRRYPDTEYLELKDEICKTEPIDADQILLVNGSIQAIYALCSMPWVQNVYAVEPCFNEYRMAAQVYEKTWHPLMWWNPSDFTFEIPDNFDDIIPHSLVFLCNPNNPTGISIDKIKIKNLAQQIQDKHSFWVVDEAFIEFSMDQSCIEFLNELENIIILRSFTKYYGLASLRIGYIAAPQCVIEKLHKFIPPWPVNGLAEKIGIQVLKHQAYFNEKILYWLKERDRLADEIKKIQSVQVYPSTTPYFLIEWEINVEASSFFDYLAQQKIMIRNCSNFYGLDDRFFRICAQDPESNAYFIQKIQDFYQ